MTAKRITWDVKSISNTMRATTAPTNSWKSCSATGIRWDDDALIIDKKSGRYADPEKSAPAGSSWKILQFARALHGAAFTARSSRHHPGWRQRAGRRFAGRWGEVIFASAHTTEFAKQAYKSFKDAAAECGRNPDEMFICLGVMCVAGATKSEAEDKMAMIEKLPLEIDALSLLAEGLNFDFAARRHGRAHDRQRTRQPDRHADDSRSRHQDQRQDESDRARFPKYNNRGQTHGAVVGGPKEIADYLEDMFVNRGCDGFVVAATHVPGAYVDFVKHVDAGIAEAWPLSQGLCRRYVARKSRTANAEDR